MKPLTEQIVEMKQITAHVCPDCGIPRPTYRDRQGQAYYIRHLQSGRGNWCPQSSQPVKTP